MSTTSGSFFAGQCWWRASAPSFSCRRVTRTDREARGRYVPPAAMALHRAGGQPVFPPAASIPGDPLTYYVGAASGGIYKTTDAGVHWQPIFDGQPVASIGSLAVATSDPNIVWAGTGEGKIRSHVQWARHLQVDGCRKTWALMGLESTGRILRLVIDPKHPTPVLACALGHAYGPQQDRGVFRTTDGGPDVDANAVRGREHGLLGHRDGPQQPARAVRGYVAIRDPHVGTHERGPGSGPLHLARRRRHVEEAHGRGCRHDPLARSPSRSRIRTRTVCIPHRDRRWRAVGKPGPRTQDKSSAVTMAARAGGWLS